MNKPLHDSIADTPTDLYFGRGMRVAERLDIAMIGLNRGLVSDSAAPFGGMKQSGIGCEDVHEGVMEFLETRYVSLTWRSSSASRLHHRCVSAESRAEGG